MLDGVSWRRKTPFGLAALRQSITNAKESGLSENLGTPLASNRVRSDAFRRPTQSLAEMAVSLVAPTPTVCGNYNRKGASKNSGDGLATAVAKSIRVATPTARDWKSGKASQATHERNSRPLSEQIGGLLNPNWVEWLMGWPIGWTALEPLETDKFRQWLSAHGES
jgi:hypothetical protein